MISDNQQSLRQKLDLLYKYCRKSLLTKQKNNDLQQKWNLIKEKCTINGEDIECVKTYQHLGILLYYSVLFKETKSHLYNNALKSSFKLYKDIKSTDPFIKTLLHTFDQTIKHIVTYGSEIWSVSCKAKINVYTKHLILIVNLALIREEKYKHDSFIRTG